MKVLKKILSRPSNLTALIGYDQGITRRMEEFLGFSFESVVFVLKDGAMDEYRLGDKELKKVLLDIFFNHSPKVKSLLRVFKKDYKELENLVKSSKKLILNKKDIISLINKFEIYYQRIWSPVVLIFWIPRYLDKRKLSLAERKLLNELIEVRFNRDKEFVLAQWFYDNIYKYIVSSFKNIDTDLNLCTPKELISIIKSKGVSYYQKKKIAARKNKCFVFRGRVYPFNTKSSINQFLKKYGYVLEREKRVKLSKILKGVPANRGKAKGRVRILLSKRQMQYVKKGDIIVSVMTSPYFNPVLKKASAIITDEGGITCHAAIVSRELGIPCIVGTKIASKVLKDGDKVEVNAIKGIVKKI